MPFNSLNTLISRLVFAGCGGKAGAYSGVYEAIDETGVLPHVNHVAGSSSGSFSAAMIAVDVKPRAIKTIMHNTNLAGLMGERSGQLLKHKHDGSFVLSKDGKPLEQFIRKQLTSTIGTFLNTADLHAHEELKLLRRRLQHNQNAKITFKDLDNLCQAFPNKYKQLTVHAVSYPDGALKIFNSKLTPDVDIAEACRASSSIPIILEPKMIDGTMYMDGSVYDNLPTEYFDVDEKNQVTDNKKPHETMVFCFGTGANPRKNPIFQALFGRYVPTQVSDFDQFQGNVLPKFLVGLNTPYRYTDKEQQGYEKIRTRYALRTVELHAGKLQSFQFDDAKKYARTLDAYGYLDTVQFVINHDLHNPKQFQPFDFYKQVLDHFFTIYKAILLGAGENPEDDSLLSSVRLLEKELENKWKASGKSRQERELIINREIFQWVKEAVQPEIDTALAFALTRAVEVKNNNITNEQLLKESYLEATKRNVKLALFGFVFSMIFHDDSKPMALNHSLITEFYNEINTPLAHQFDMLQEALLDEKEPHRFQNR